MRVKGVAKQAAVPASILFKHEDVLLCAHLLQYLRPYRDADLAQVSLSEQKHQRARLADPASNRERNLVGQYPVVVRQLRQIKLM